MESLIPVTKTYKFASPGTTPSTEQQIMTSWSSPDAGTGVNYEVHNDTNVTIFVAFSSTATGASSSSAPSGGSPTAVYTVPSGIIRKITGPVNAYTSVWCKSSGSGDVWVTGGRLIL